MLYDIFLITISAVLLWLGAEWIVESAAAIARKFNVSELIIGLTIVAAGTSAPEFLVTGMAAFKGVHDISLSNVVGSNIFNLGFILGLMAMIKPIPTSRVMVYRDGLLLWITTGIILAVSFTGHLPRAFGFGLTAMLVCYLAWLGTRGRKEGLFPTEDTEAHTASWKDWIKLPAGFIAIAAGGHFMVEGASSIALSMGVSRWVIGVTIVAAGTSLPELVTCLAASLKGRNDMLLGNLIGSDFFNFAGVLGLTCMLKPLDVSPDALPSLMVLVGMIGLVLIFLRTRWSVSRTEGAILFGITMLRWVRDFMG